MGLADDALKMGLRTASIPIKPVCPPFEAHDLDAITFTNLSDQSLLSYPDMIREYVNQHMREVQAREWQWAFLLWGIHK